MFNENLKTLRKRKGLSQESLAAQLHVIRQTISKWEKGISVPDVEILFKLADILEVSVSELLGQKIDGEKNSPEVAEQLSQLAEQLAIKNRHARHILKIILGIIIGLIIAVTVYYAAGAFWVVVGVDSSFSGVLTLGIIIFFAVMIVLLAICAYAFWRIKK